MSIPAESPSEWNRNPPLRSALSASSGAMVAEPNVVSRSWIRQLAWPAALALLGMAALSVDVSVARWFRIKGLPGDLDKFCQLSEVFGHGLGAGAILLTAWVLVPEKRIRLVRVIGATYLAGLGANVFKLCLARQRPHTIGHMLGTHIFDTFKGWFPLFSSTSDWQSFPSSHTAVAVGLAIGLTLLFPRGKWLFVAFAGLAFTQRVASGNHFPSDAFWGGAIGWLCATACMPGGWLSPIFDRLEAWQLARSNS